MAAYLDALNHSRCLIPQTSLGGDWLSQLDQARRVWEPLERSRHVAVRIQAVFLNVILLPVLSFGAIVFTVCNDFPSRAFYCFHRNTTEQNKSHLLAMVIFCATFAVRWGCYLGGKRDLLFPVDYKTKGFASELDPILEMVKKPRLSESFIREKVRGREAAVQLEPDESARERFFCHIARQEGGVEWLRQLPAHMLKRGPLEQQEFTFLVDQIIATYKYELLAEAFDLPRDGFDLPDSFIPERIEAHREALQARAPLARPYATARQKFYYTILHQEQGMQWLRGVPSTVINSSVLNRGEFLFLLRRIIQTDRFELLSLFLDLPRERMELTEPLKEIMALAIERRDQVLINKVIDAGLNPTENLMIDERNISPLSEMMRRACSSSYPPAQRREYLELADFVIQVKRARIDAGVPSPWEIVLGFRNLEMARFLMQRGLNLNLWREIDCLMSNLSLLEFYLQLGVDLSSRNADSETFLLRAIERDQLDALRLFLHYGADPNQIGLQWPLEAALMKINKEMIKALVQKGARLNIAFGRNLYTPLTYAVIIQDVDLVRFFLQNGADRNFKRWNYMAHSLESPLDLARKSGNRELIDLLSDKKEGGVLRGPKEVPVSEKPKEKKPSFFERLFSKNVKARGSKGIFDDDDRKEAPLEKPKRNFFG